LRFDLKVENPNPVGISVRNVTYDLKINSRNFTKGTLDQGLKLPANGTGVIQLPVTVPYFDLFDSVAELFKRETVAYDLSGTVGVGPFDIPYRSSGELPIPKLPEIRLKSVDVAALSLTGADLVFTLGLKNVNAFPIDVTELTYDIKLGGKAFAQGLVRQTAPLQAEVETPVEVALRVSFFDLGRSAYHLLLDPSAGYELTGEMRLKNKTSGPSRIPFKLNGQVDVHR
jgi:LEA14-like dessication related protein